MFGDGVERPHPRVQNGAVLHLLGQTVLFACCFESRVAYGVRITVTVGARLCGDAGDCQSAENCGKAVAPTASFLLTRRPSVLPGRELVSDVSLTFLILLFLCLGRYRGLWLRYRGRCFATGVPSSLIAFAILQPCSVYSIPVGV